MPNTPTITDAEWRVMNLLWERSPLTSGEICDALALETGWKLSTVKTLLARLAEKGAIDHEPRGREYLYRPLVARTAAIRSETGKFLERFFGGAIAPMVAHFAEEHQMTDSELAALRAILDEASKRGGGGESGGGV
jgi:BlaI family penicillinase repressor